MTVLDAGDAACVPGMLQRMLLIIAEYSQIPSKEISQVIDIKVMHG